MILRKRIQAHENLSHHRRAVRRSANGNRVRNFIPGNVGSAPPLLPITADELIAQDGEQPCPEVAIALAKMPAADRALETILHQIIRCIMPPHHREGVATQRRRVSFQKDGRLVQLRILSRYCRPAQCFPPTLRLFGT